MQDLTNQADQLLPGPAGSKEEASQPLKQRLAEAWNGKVRCRWQSAVHPCCGCYDMGADWCIEQLTATVLFVCFQRMAAVTLAACGGSCRISACLCRAASAQGPEVSFWTLTDDGCSRCRFPCLTAHNSTLRRC